MPKDWRFAFRAHRNAARRTPAARPQAACWRAELTSRVSVAGVLLMLPVLLVLAQVLPPVLLTMLLVLQMLVPVLLVLVVLSPRRSWGHSPRRAAHRSEMAEPSPA